MMPAPAILGARGAVRVLSAPDAADWMPPTSGRELARVGLIGTAGDMPVLMLALADDIDARRVVVFVLLGDLLCTFRPTGEANDALEVVLPFRLGTQRALAVIVECTTEAEAEELARRYDAARAGLEPPPFEEARRAESADEAEPPLEAELPETEAPPPPMTRSAPPPPPLPSAPSFPFPMPAPTSPPPRRGGAASSALAVAHVHAEMPRRVAVDTEFEVRFRLSRRRLEASAGTSHTAQAIRVDAERDLTVTIALRGFRLVGDQPATVVTRLPRSADDVDEHRFRLIGPLPGHGEVSLVVRQDADLPLATLRITAEIVAVGTPVDLEPADAAADVVEPDPELVALPSIRIDESIVGTDSTLRIRVAVAGDARECETHLDDKAAFISRTYRRIGGIRDELRDIQDRDDRARHGLRRLRDLGMGLARSLFSRDVLDLLWGATPDELEGLIVQTAGELDLPWEVVHLVPPVGVADDGRPRFLSGYGLTRWVYDTAHPTDMRVEPDRVRYVCPEYAEHHLHLTHTTEERRFLEARFQATTVVPDDADGIAGLMHDGFDLLHFAGHGRWSNGTPQTQELLLAAFSEAEDVPLARYSDGELRRDLPDRGAADAAAAGPFVFLNACDVGRLPSGPAALGGFPEAFLRGGAAAFVGCSWAVGDDPASTFVEAFYVALADGEATIADATRAARLAARDDADLSELAYAVYAHPRARIHLDPTDPGRTAIMNALRPPSPSAPPPPTDAASASRGGPSLSAAALADLRPHVVTLEDGKLATGASAAATSVGDFRTTAEDIDAIFTTHLPAFIAQNAPGPVPIVLYAHGGLVDKEAGFGIASRQIAWWKENGVYPIHFVWETGLGTALWDALRRWASGGRRGWVDEAKDAFLEVAARLLGGGGIWNDMKVDAAAASVKGGGGHAFVRALGKWMTEHPGEVEVHAVGHSAGSIFHSHLLPAALEAKVPAIASLNLLAPAVRVDTFSKLLLPHAKSGKIGRLAIFTMDDEAERADTCLRIYNKSLLYLVSASFEPQKATPILGMARFITRDAELADFFTGASADGELVLAPNAVGVRAASAATSHGDFDNDAPTMESVARRIAGVTDVTPFPKGRARTVEPWPEYEDLPAADGSRSVGGARRALCIGVDAYPDEGDRLQGCVADAHAWSEALRGSRVRRDRADGCRGHPRRDPPRHPRTREQRRAGRRARRAVLGARHVRARPRRRRGRRRRGEGRGAVPRRLPEGGPAHHRRRPRAHLGRDPRGREPHRVLRQLPLRVGEPCAARRPHAGRRRPSEGGRADPRATRRRTAPTAEWRRRRPSPIRCGMPRSRACARPRPPRRRAPRNAGVRREVLFSACRATEVAWESGGQGDFTRAALPLLESGVGSVSNRDFVRSVVEVFGPNRRQTPEFHGEDVLGGRILLGTASASTVENGQPAAEAPAAPAAPTDGKSATPTGARHPTGRRRRSSRSCARRPTCWSADAWRQGSRERKQRVT